MTEKDKTNWTPQITYELLYGNSLGFREIVKRFREWAQAQPVEPLPVTTGWCHITPEIAEHLLRRNSKNRVVNYDNGALLDGQHRLMMGVLSVEPGLRDRRDVRGREFDVDEDMLLTNSE